MMAPCARLTEAQTMSVKWQLLLGILALQNDFVNRTQLLAAFNAWVADKSKPLGAWLLEQKALSPDYLALLEHLTDAHLRHHDNDADKSLAALGPLPEVRQDLERAGDA